jgi:AraC-like DNA-binding protein
MLDRGGFDDDSDDMPVTSEPRYEHVPLVAQALCRVQLMDELSIPFVWHYHPEHELILIRSGTGHRFVAESVAHYTPPDLVLLGPNIPHTWASHIAVDAGPHSATVVQFAPDLLGGEFFARPEVAQVAALLQRSSAGLHFPLREHDPVLGMIGELERSEGFARLLNLLTVLHNLADRADAVALTHRGWSQHPSTGGRRLEAALRLLHERFADEVRLADAARAASLTPSAFSRFFRATIGQTFTDYLNDLRIGAAQRMLVSTDLPIAAIAVRVGFSSLANFNRRFRERTGCTPREFRNREPTPV